MVNVKTIQTTEAQPPLRDLYQEIEETVGFIPNVFNSSSKDYEITKWLWQGLKTIMLRESSIPRSLKEEIALVVSKNNSCSYCVGVHNYALTTLGLDSKKVEELGNDYQSSSISDKEKAILDFALKITNESYKIIEKDHENLKKHGMTEQQILEVISIASLFNFINRFVDALGTDLETF